MKVKILFPLLLAAVIYISCGNKASGQVAKLNEARVTVPVVETKMMIVAKLTVKPDKTKDFINAAREIIEKSNKETGCISYQLYQDPYDNSKFVFVEEYKNQAAIDTHFAADYFKAFGPKISDFVQGPAKIKIVSVAKEVNQ